MITGSRGSLDRRGISDSTRIARASISSRFLNSMKIRQNRVAFNYKFWSTSVKLEQRSCKVRVGMCERVPGVLFRLECPRYYYRRYSVISGITETNRQRLTVVVISSHR